MGKPRALGAVAALALLACAPAAVAESLSPVQIQQAVEAHVGRNGPRNAMTLWEAGYPGGAAVVVVVKAPDARTQSYFFNYGCAVGTRAADNAPCVTDKEQRPPAPMTSDTIINLASVGKLFAALYLAQGVLDGDIRLEDSPADAKYHLGLTGACIKGKTLGEIVSQSSGLPYFPDRRDCPAPPKRQFDYPQFIANLNCWGNAPRTCPLSGNYQYSDLGFILLRLTLFHERHDTPFPKLVQKFADDVGMTATTMSVRPGQNPVAQGYRCYPAEGAQGDANDCNGEPVPPKAEQDATWYEDRWRNGGQIWSSAKDMALLAELALNADIAKPTAEKWKAAMQKTEEIIFDGKPRVAMAWQEVVTADGTNVLGKNGGNGFTSTYIGMAKNQRIAVVVLINRGAAKAAKVGQEILGRLAAESR